MDFLAMDKIFCHGQKIFVQDNLGFVLDKNYFVRAEGRGNRPLFCIFEKTTIFRVWLFAWLQANVEPRLRLDMAFHEPIVTKLRTALL